jgi:heparan-alpha-glucosaminide N-acetyltransferase
VPGCGIEPSPLQILPVVYYFFYWLVDIKKIQSWAGFLKPVGSNPLLAYILPNLAYSALGLMGITFLHAHFKSGFPGIFRSLGFALFNLGLTALLSKLKL